MNILENCKLCPRNCCANRYIKNGVCGAGINIKIANYSLHMWEEPVISGINGSGTVFFSNCNLKCVFCQNKKISTGGYGKEITNERLSQIFLNLQKKGAHNINLVTPTHYVPQIIESLKLVRNKSLNIPVVYNTSSYENVETIKMLKNYVDIYLADLKYYDDTLAKKYSHCNNYFEYATDAIDQMVMQTGKFIIKNNLMIKGVIVRILILPGHTLDAKKIIKYLYDKYGDNIIISIMNQYTPLYFFEKYPNLNKKISNEEYYDVINYACDIGVKNAFIQEGETQSDSFIPVFDINNI